MLGFNAKKVDLEDFDPSQLAECRLAVFLMATYGEGEHTDNSTSFNNWMKNESMEDRGSFLKDVSFTVFGLGNRQYEHFNQMGKRTNEALHNFGGKRVFTYGEGDDDGSLEDDFEKWKSSMWIDLIKQFHPNASAAADNSDKEITVQLTYKLIPTNSVSTSTVKVHSNKPFFQSRVVSTLSLIAIIFITIFNVNVECRFMCSSNLFRLENFHLILNILYLPQRMLSSLSYHCLYTSFFSLISLYLL